MANKKVPGRPEPAIKNPTLQFYRIFFGSSKQIEKRLKPGDNRSGMMH
jgi:hypothetical protein